MTTRQTNDHPVLRRTEPGDHDKFAHYVLPPSAITRSMVTGTPVKAICGKVWIPSRDPAGFPICPDCVEIRDEIMGSHE